MTLNEQNLKEEALRCFMCKNPRCKANCPISTPIPEVIGLFKEDKIKEAGDILFENNPLSVVCSIVCPHENQCKGNCIRGIKETPVNFSEIERLISTEYLENLELIQSEILEDKIAIIGGGPAGITAAFILAKKGYQVTIFEENDKIGGVLRYGIPDFRLSREIIDKYEEALLKLNVKIRPNTLVGKVITLDMLKNDGYKAIFIATGVWNPKTLNVKGETLGNVHYAIDYLKAPKSYNLGEKVVIIGAGNVAMDAARTAKRNGADTYVLYRKSFEDMPATKVEIEEAKEDGIKFELYKAPLEIYEDGIKYIKTERIVSEDGRTSFRSIEDSEDIFKCDSIIVAISQAPRDNIVSTSKELSINKWGLVETDENGITTMNGVFASGDVVSGPKTVVEAVANSKKVSEAIDEFCKNN
ncbi:NAD(P)-dependent oxidoreductase [Clostridium sp.]|uniref:NAD(P)-dependent oxidoreductase n=1 Tax=Clostridium sp. TaxID=1506 RepID=UPI00262CA52A|nr:NAD(P)-dependent oxidoreductase [Clostridium sp.]